MPYQPMSKEQLERFHADFVHVHSSPSREKFLFEFKAGQVPESMIPSRRGKRAEPSAIRKDTAPAWNDNRKLETSSQFSYRAGFGPSLPRQFCPETKHRFMKQPEHDYQEQLFLLYNIHGKPK